jgi:iron complex transport system substrate-binding protein
MKLARLIPLTIITLLVGCGSQEPPTQIGVLTQEPLTCEEGFRVFDHELLSTDPICIPEEPQRILTLGMPSFETLMALGVTPFASPAPYINNYAGYYPTLAYQVEGVQNLGPLALTSLERAVEGDPDLIIGHEARFVQYYDDFTAIAPTLLYEFEHSGIWQEVADFVAQTVDREAEYEALLTEYDTRVADLQTSLDGADPVTSVVRIRPREVRLYVVDSYPGSVLEDVGLPRPESQQYESEAMRAEFGQSTFYGISEERIELADGDVIFIWTSSPTQELAQDSEERLQELMNDPLWSQLDAVQQGNAYEVGGHWIGASFVAAHYMLDDLFRHVVGVNPAEVSPNPFQE